MRGGGASNEASVINEGLVLSDIHVRFYQSVISRETQKFLKKNHDGSKLDFFLKYLSLVQRPNAMRMIVLARLDAL